MTLWHGIEGSFLTDGNCFFHMNCASCRSSLAENGLPRGCVMYVRGAIKTGREGQAHGVGILVRHEIFLLTRTTRSALGPTQPLFQSVTEPFSPGIKLPVHTTDDSPPSSPEIRNT